MAGLCVSEHALLAADKQPGRFASGSARQLSRTDPTHLVLAVRLLSAHATAGFSQAAMHAARASANAARETPLTIKSTTNNHANRIPRSKSEPFRYPKNRGQQTYLKIALSGELDALTVKEGDNS